LIAINGSDSSAMNGKDTIVRNGDIVSIIPVIHGGLIKKVNF
jgi:ThiS family.